MGHERVVPAQRGRAVAGVPMTKRHRIITLPLEPGLYAQLEYPHPLSPQAWERMHHILAAMRPGLVDEPEQEWPEAIWGTETP